MKGLLEFFKYPYYLIADTVFLIKKKGFSFLRHYDTFLKLFFSRKLSAEEWLNYSDSLQKSPSFRQSFLSYREASDFWTVLNPRNYASLARDKYLTHILLENAGIPKPQLYAYYNANSSNYGKVACDYDTLRKVLLNNSVQDCVVKPASDSAHGNNVFVCKEIHYGDEDCLLTKSNGERVSLRYLCDSCKKTPLLFEQRVVQSRKFNLLNPSSVNTVRMMTSLYPGGKSLVFASWMRMGRKGSDVDNASSGGNVDCAIEVETGKCYNASQFNSFSDVIKIERHPDSGEQVEGFLIDDWEDIKTALCEYQSRIPYLKAIGWDVAITEKGPVIIEINNWWDPTGQLFIGKGWRDSVLKCYKAWKTQ